MEQRQDQAITTRRAQLARYAAVYAETYGHTLDVTRLEATDAHLADLLEAAR